MTTDQTTLASRCSTTVTLVRADQLRLLDQVLVQKWDGTVEVRTVASLSLVGDDVEMTFTDRSGELSTSQGNTFQVVSAR